MLRWSRVELAGAAETGVKTVEHFENETVVSKATTVTAIRAALEAAGVEFINGNARGVRLAKKAGA